MSNYSDKSDGDGNMSSNNASMNASDQAYNSRVINSNNTNSNNRSRSRSPISNKSRSRSRSRSYSHNRSLSPANTNSNSNNRDSYKRTHRDQSPRYNNSYNNSSKRRDRSLSSNNRYSSAPSSKQRRPNSVGRRRSRSPINVPNGSHRYNQPPPPPPPPQMSIRNGSRHSPSEYSSRHFNGHHNSDHADRFNPPENEILAIFGLSKHVNEQDLFELYKHYGCKECKIIIDKHTGCPKGYGFVYFGRVREAVLAKKETDGKMLLNKAIRVDFSIGERDFSQSQFHNSNQQQNHHQQHHHHHPPPPPPPPPSQNYSSSMNSYSSKPNYLDSKSSRYSSSYSSSTTSSSHPDYYRRDQRPPILTRELISRDYRDHRDRSPPPPPLPRHMNRYPSPPMSPPPLPPPSSRQSAIQRFNQQNGYGYSSNSNKDDRNPRRNLSPNRVYRRTPPAPTPRSRSRSRSLDRGHRRYNNDVNSDYYNNRTSNGNSMPRYNDNMINHANRRRIA